MKITFITLKMSDGGAERVISVLSSKLAQLNIGVDILKYMATEGEYLVDEKVNQYTLFDTKDAMGIDRLIRIKAIRKFLKEHKTDVVIPFLDAMVGDTFLAAAGLNIPVIATVRNNPDMTIGIGPKIKDFIFGCCKAVFLQTESQKKFFSQRTVKKSFVVPNPVDEKILNAGVDRCYNVQPVTVVACGRLTPQKNYPMLIEAFTRVRRLHPKVRLNIYGVGEEADNLKALISQYEANEYIHLMGRSTNIWQVLKEADIYVLSSDYEGLPNSLLEAMSMGCVCVSTDCPTGPKDALGDNERGYLCNTGDASDLSDTLCKVIDNYSEATKKAKLARKYAAENYEPEIVARKLVSELEKYLETDN